MSASDVVVVIPFYDGSKFIRRAVESVLSQTMPPAEFVVVNDGSKPEEAAFLQALAEEMHFKVLDKDNGGQGSARNAGVAATSSPYVCFLDQDDLFLPDHIEVLRKAVSPDSRFGWAYADLIEADGDAQVVRTATVKAYTMHPKADVFRLIREDMFVLPSASIISRPAFEAVEGFDPQFMGYEDDDLFLRMFRAGYTNIFVDRPVTIWCMHSASTSFSIRMSRSRFRYFKKLLQTFPNDPPRNRFVLRDQLIPRFHRAFIGEAFQAICRPRTARGTVFGPHLDELLKIARDYRDIVVGDPFVCRRRKWIVRLQASILATKSPVLCEAALLLARLTRRSL
ncbi:glycosyltransferase family A protein [Mesorhizobium sp. KR9-304]|uniref:glycosyltransferase family 2 protein n=1 Tax=Mesorhizobium sp. KR9-304 TaxID=3156614 RepID=UPI0032B367CA